MAVASKSAYIQLFDKESKDDTYSFLVTNEQAKMKFEDSRTDRDMEFKAQGYKFKYGTDLAGEFDLDGRFTQLETDVATNAADPLPGQNQAAIAAMDVAYKAKDAQIEAAASAEVTRASTEEARIEGKCDDEKTRAEDAEAVLQGEIDAEASARATAVSAEQARAEAAEQSLQTQISSLLSNVDPALVDSISELLSHVNSADSSLIASIAALQSEHDDLKARVDQLTNE